MRASLDILASTGLPIWLTEVNVAYGPNQAEYLEQVLREGHSHPSVEGITCMKAQLIEEWKTKPTEIKADSEGSIEVSLFDGDCKINVKDPITNSLASWNYNLIKDDTIHTVHIHINA
ncbi:hypothetical protein GH714_011359 [Hevea brasiliensis]|uniref:Uncharacterized protein n=1 Tax=Hevea brasiliensis TaxID=3981 RepID=A0A6A6L446_HEVBR|nr:hypothetical protein GH714_011359 [Hevea brasiliensis]